jgi:CheY-like chemotaxis protein/DNA-binding CsgD family transcriptional regulator
MSTPRRPGHVVLIVDDAPENLAALHDTLDESGYTVLAATSGAAALDQATRELPDLILLDATMPRMDGFETCRRLRAQQATRNIPVIFMTGPVETGETAAAFDAGGNDYVTKPIRQNDMLTRVAALLPATRQANQTRNAMDAFGNAVLAVTPHNGRIVWQTPLARQWMQEYFALKGAGGGAELRTMPLALAAWLAATAQARRQGHDYPPLSVMRGVSRLEFTAADLSNNEQWMIMLREESECAQVQALMSLFRMTLREAEVLHWLSRGRSTHDISHLLGATPQMVDSYVAQICGKLEVDTGGAAAALAMDRLRAGMADALM